MTPLMSFWPKVFNKIILQEKLIEYRRNFPKDCSYAYMYITKPIKSICAIIYFGKIHSLKDLMDEYTDNKSIFDRIKNFDSSYRYAAEIKSVQMIKPITLECLRKNIPNFVAPQSYILLENNPLLSSFLNENTVFIGESINNNLSNVIKNNICKEIDYD